jgi:hypothetical protein
MGDIISTDSRFSEAEKRALALLADMMIPASGAMPSAADAAIFPRTLAGLSANADVVTEALATFAELAATQHQQTLDALGTTQLDELVEQLKRLRPNFIQVLQAGVISSYYQDDRVLLELGMPARSPHPGGYEVAATDWSLLDPVRKREPFYRQAGSQGGNNV